jgi:hypothetical protein
LELAAIDARLERYRHVADREDVAEARREAVRTCGWIGDRLSTLKNERGEHEERDEAREWLGLNPVVSADRDTQTKRQRSSMRTFFEMRGRWWILFPLSWALLLGAAALTWWLVKG